MEVCTVLKITGRLDTMEWLLGAMSLVDPERWESQGKVILGGRMSKHRRDQKKTRWLKEVRAQHGSIGVTERLELSTAKAQVWETDVGATVCFLFFFFFKDTFPFWSRPIKLPVLFYSPHSWSTIPTIPLHSSTNTTRNFCKVNTSHDSLVCMWRAGISCHSSQSSLNSYFWLN